MDSMDEHVAGAAYILLNNTVLSNFAKMGRMDLLETAVRGRAATTEAVLQEFNEGVTLGHLPVVSLDWLPVLAMSAEEETTFELTHLRLGAGEASCLALAQHRNMRFAADDGDARGYAQRMGIPLSGTLGILVQLLREKTLTLEEGNALLSAMVQQGYRAPVADLSLLAG